MEVGCAAQSGAGAEAFAQIFGARGGVGETFEQGTKIEAGAGR